MIKQHLPAESDPDRERPGFSRLFDARFCFCAPARSAKDHEGALCRAQQFRHLAFKDYTFLKQSEEQNDLRTHLWQTARGAHLALFPNLNANDEVWRDLFREGIVEHSLKELCRVYVSRTTKCEYCGNQRSVKGAEQGLVEGQYDELLNFESAEAFDDRQKAALAYAEAIAWHLDTDDAFWDRLHAHFTEPELVELGCMIGLTLGQQSWLRLLNIDHHQVMPGTEASMAPGFETREALEASKAERDYWAKV